jgi:phage repressor protein C with HTH and peptisase S24 domain
MKDRLALASGKPAEIVHKFQLLKEPAGRKYTEFLPVYSLVIAAGSFGKPSVSECLDWVKTPAGMKASERHFVAQVTGKSMEPTIPDGAFCVFRFGVEGSRNGKIVLARLSEAVDPETGGRYTVKKYSSVKVANRDHEWEHMRIQLLPLNPDFQPIEIPQAAAGSVSVVAEFIQVLAE